MEHVDRWLRLTTWHNVVVSFYGGTYAATAYEYPEHSEASRRWVFEGSGMTAGDALADLGRKLARLERGRAAKEAGDAG